MANPYAYFDCLAICDRLERIITSPSRSQMHLFTYLSCLLSLYNKNTPVSWWGYTFSTTPNGYPFSVDVDEELKALLSRNCIKDAEDCLALTSTGHEEYKKLRDFSQNKEREIFIEGACSTTLAMPLGIIRNAVSFESEIRGAVALGQSSMLFSEGQVVDIHKQFEIINTVVGPDRNDLMVPAIVWLTCLNDDSCRNNANADGSRAG